MTILGRGDLSPPRRHRSWGRLVLVVVVLAVLVGAGYVGYVRFIRSSSAAGSTTTGLSRCPKHVARGPYAAPHTLRVRVLNASLQTGLAARVRSSLRHRGFRVVQIGNAPRVGRYVASVSYSPDQKLGSATLAAQVLRATTRVVPGRGVLELELGLKYRHMRASKAATALARRTEASAAPTPSPSPSRSCTPRVAS